MWWWNGFGPMPWAFGPLMIVVFILLCMGRRALMMRGMPGRHLRRDDALAILQERFARGEISEDEYWQRRHILQS